MKPTTAKPAPSAGDPSPRLGRRGLLLGAGVAGAAAAPAAAEGTGYRLTPHVLRYYETTKA